MAVLESDLHRRAAVMGDELAAKVTIRKKGQVTIKKELLDAINANIGDEINFKVVDGMLIGIPHVSVPKEEVEIFELYKDRLNDAGNPDAWVTTSIKSKEEFIKKARKKAGMD